MRTASVAINCGPHQQRPNCSGGYTEVSSGPVAQDARLSLVKRAFSAKSLDELFFILTNDIRTLIEFDRASLITHVRGASRITATDNEPALNKKTEFVIKQNMLASALSSQKTALLLSNRTTGETWPDLPISPELNDAIKSYMEFSGFARLLLIPLTHRKTLIGHLALEFEAKNRPSDSEIHSFMDLSPVFAAALMEKILLSLKPELTALVCPQLSGIRHRSHFQQYLAFSAMGVMALILVLFVIPFPFTLSGEAQITSSASHMAFAGTEGILDKVLINEGQKVDQGQLLASLDPRELDFQIMSWSAQRDILTHEMNRLMLEAGEKPASLAEKKSVELKREAALTELKFLKWKKQLLEIRAPVSGTVVTKDVHTLGGKRLRAGETFCEIAAPEELSAQVYVPEERISDVKVSQDVAVYLNTDPTKAYRLKVDRIAPAPDVLPRIGTVYRVFAPFGSSVDSLKVGMKGIGKVNLTETTLWNMISYRLATRWNQLSLYL
jgi:multidrug resistance efflux pump